MKREPDERTLKEMVEHPRNYFEEVAARAIRSKESARPGQRDLFERGGKPAFSTADGEPRANSPEDVGARTEIPQKNTLRSRDVKPVFGRQEPRWDSSPPPERQTPETELRDRLIYGQSFTRIGEEGPERVDPLSVPAAPIEPHDVTSNDPVPCHVEVPDVVSAELPENTGTTGWHLLQKVTKARLYGLDPASHQALDLIRFAPGDSPGQVKPVTRLWTVEGKIAGLSNGHRTAGQPEKGLLMADDAGVALLRGTLPSSPQPLPDGTSWNGRLKFYPFSVVKWIAVAVGLEELCRAALWINRRETIEVRMGVPLFGLDRGDYDALSRFPKPKGVGLLVTDDELAAWIEEEMWGTKVERGGW